MGKLSKVVALGFILLLYKRRNVLTLDITRLLINIVALFVKTLRLSPAKREIGKMETFKSDFVQGFDTPTAQHIALTKIIALDNRKARLDLFRTSMEKNPVFSVCEDDSFTLTSNEVKSKASNKVTYYECKSHHVTEKDNVLFYIHGGGYISGSVNSYLGIVSRLSSSTGLTVIAPEYGLSPEYTQPQQIEQIRSVYFKIKASYEVILIGDSAGAGLCVGLLQSLTNSEPKPKAAVLISPYVDLESNGDSYTVNQKTDPVIKSSLTDLFETHCSTSFKNNSFENIEKFTSLEVYITASEEERLYSDAVFLANTLSNMKNVVVFFESAKYGVHDYPLLSHIVKEYQPSYDRICSFIRSSWEFRPGSS